MEMVEEDPLGCRIAVKRTTLVKVNQVNCFGGRRGKAQRFKGLRREVKMGQKIDWQ